VTALTRRRTLVGVLALAAAPVRAEEPIVIGVSGPLTGQYAQYGAEWKRGFDLAIEAVNTAGGIGGRPVRYQFEDSQSDPRQAVAIAQKFVNDPRVVVEIGDFSSAASMAASPIYQRGKLVQFGFTNSHPDFTKGGDYMWSNAPNQSDDMPILAAYAVKSLGLKKLGVLFINGDWGRSSKDLLVKAVDALGGQIVAAEGYLADEKDYRSTLVRVRDAAPDGLVLISYYPDGALIARQIRSTGLTQPVVATSSVYSPKFLELGGDAVEGVYTMTNFFPDSPKPVVRDFVARYQAAYHTEPGSYPARGYDAMVLLLDVMKQFGATRQGIHDGLGRIKDVPSVVYGTVQFDPATRRVKFPSNIELVVKGGAFALWDGKPARS
jgi:branched-chain amino acid transport system substrate-binding protein